MIRIVFELVVLACVVGAILYLARQLDQRRPAGRELVEAPADAVWRATHHGNASEQTEVQIILRGGDAVWDRRTCAVIGNQDPDYDRLLFNALEDARVRADLLNRMRED